MTARLLAAEFDRLRPRLIRVAYATTGSLAEAEDCVQDAWLRLQRVDNPTSIRDLEAWSTTAVSRLALDALGSARVRREQYVGPWLPEPLVEDVGPDAGERIELAETISTALLIVLERLSPAERVAFILHDVFGMSFDEIREVVGRSSEAVRQLASRARRHIEADRPRFPATHAHQRQLVAAFTTACQDGDMARMVSLLDPEVIWRTDTGGKISAKYEIERGALPVAEALLTFTRQRPRSLQSANVNGAPGIVLRDSTGILTVIAFTIDRGLITAIDAVRNPDKLRSVRGIAGDNRLDGPPSASDPPSVSARLRRACGAAGTSDGGVCSPHRT